MKDLKLLGILIGCSLMTGSEAQRPEPVPWFRWVNTITNVHLTNMTAELTKDLILKMNIAKNIMKLYKAGSTYKLGEIIANAKDLFIKMVDIYKDITLYHRFRESTPESTEKSQIYKASGFALAQSYYHRIRLEKKLFDTIIREDSRATKIKMDELIATHGAIPPEWGMKEPLKGGIYNGRRTIDNIELPSYAVKVPDLTIDWELSSVFQNSSEETLIDAENPKQQMSEGQPDARTPDARTPDARTPDARTPDARTPDARTPDARTQDVRTPTSGNTKLQFKNEKPFGVMAKLRQYNPAPPFSRRKYGQGYKSRASGMIVPGEDATGSSTKSRTRPAPSPARPPPTRRTKKPIWRPKIN